MVGEAQCCRDLYFFVHNLKSIGNNMNNIVNCDVKCILSLTALISLLLEELKLSIRKIKFDTYIKLFETNYLPSNVFIKNFSFEITICFIQRTYSEMQYRTLVTTTARCFSCATALHGYTVPSSEVLIRLLKLKLSLIKMN